jgi:hypothetical protein
MNFTRSCQRTKVLSYMGPSFSIAWRFFTSCRRTIDRGFARQARYHRLMDTSLPHSRRFGGCGDAGGAASTSRGWVVLWTLWGLVVAALVALLDPNPWLAIPWALGGVLIGLFALRLLRPFATPLMQWYRRHDAKNDMMLDFLMAAGKMHPDDDALEQYLRNRMESKEYRRTRDHEIYWWSMAVPPLGGLIYGLLFGGIGGALCGLDGESGITASEAAALGLIVGPVFLAAVGATTFACIVPPPGDSFAARLAHRGLMLLSPLLFVPCLWYCVRTLARSSGRISHY